MIESFEFVSDEGYSLEFNDESIPFEEFRTDVNVRNEERDKMEEHGTWPSYTYLGRRLFIAEGSVIAQTSAEYMAKRLEIMRVLMPYPQKGRRRVGQLKILFTGFLERVVADCTIDAYPEIPLKALFPAASEFQVIWKA